MFLTGDRLQPFQLQIGNSFPSTDSLPDSWENQLCYSHTEATTNGEVITVSCQGTAVGRVVILSLPGTDRIMNICEVEVHGKSFKDHHYDLYVA